MHIRHILSAVVAIAACASSSLQGVHASEASKSLTGADFSMTVAEDTTFVKFYSPNCGHCRALAPTWEQLAVEHQDWEVSRGFKFAEVNCLLEGDICDDHDVTGYPSLQLFHNGKVVDQYTKGRQLREFNAYVESKAKEYASESSSSRTGAQDGMSTVNPLGQVVVLDAKNHQSTIQDGPWLVEYYAPWCGHCKALAPIYEELAMELKGKVNVAKVDCTTSEALCRSQGVRGFPTILMHQSGASVEFSGSRNLYGLKDFALGAVGPSLKEVSYNGLQEVKEDKDVIFVYVHDANTPEDVTKMMEKQSQVFYQQLSFLSSSDPAVAKELGVSGPALVVLKDNRHQVFTGSLDDGTQVQTWVQQVRQPIVVTVTNKNVNTVIGDSGWVLLGLFDPAKPASSKARSALIETAHEYRSSGRSLGSFGGEQYPLRFASLDGPKWSKYIRGTYQVEPLNLPVVIAVNSKQDIYHGVGADGRRVQLDQESLVQFLKDIEEEGVLEAQTTLSYAQRAFRQVARNTRAVTGSVKEHPFMALAVLVSVGYGLMKKMGSGGRQGQEYQRPEGGLAKAD